jgi:hypothetical protein
MYQTLRPLRQADHSGLCLLPVTDYSFARAEVVAPITIDEVASVAREYPIVFTQGGTWPVALMGVEKDANAYVGKDGQWLAAYIPAHIRQYPLAITRAPVQAANGAAKAQEQPRFVVLIDEASALLSPSEGQPLFAKDGQLAAAGQQRMRLMEQMQTRAGLTQRLVQAIDAAGLLVERAIRIQREGGTGSQVSGIRLIDEAALNKLDDAAFNALRKSGALPLVYASLLSWANFRQGPIGKSHPLPLPSGMLDEDVIRFN